MHTQRKRSVMGEKKRDDRRCHGLNWKSKGRGEKKCNRKIKEKKRGKIYLLLNLWKTQASSRNKFLY